MQTHISNLTGAVVLPRALSSSRTRLSIEPNTLGVTTSPVLVAYLLPINASRRHVFPRLPRTRSEQYEPSGDVKARAYGITSCFKPCVIALQVTLY